MLQATPALIAYLNAATDASPRDLYTIALKGGQVLRYTGDVKPLSAPASGFPGSPLNYAATGTVNFAVGPRFGRSNVSRKIGTEPTELDLRIYAGPADLIGEWTWQEAIVAGLFDGAVFELDRFILKPGADGVAGSVDASLGAVVWFYGLVADIDAGRSALALKVKSLLNLLTEQQMPRRLFQSACNHVFGDAMCLFDRDSMSASIAAGAGSSAVQIATTLSPSPATLYNQGTLTGTSGANSGISRTIDQLAGGIVTLRRELPFPVAAGDEFTLLPGCDHTTATCNGTFDNLDHFGGFPYIPPPEQAL